MLRARSGTIRSALAGFEDLPVELLIDLGEHARLVDAQATAVEAAVRAAMQNVRLRAHADEVVVHASTGDGGWELTIRDDGVGYDPGATTVGFGVRHQVVQGLADAGLKCEVSSQFGGGTCVVVRSAMRDLGPWPTPPARGCPPDARPLVSLTPQPVSEFPLGRGPFGDLSATWFLSGSRLWVMFGCRRRAPGRSALAANRGGSSGVGGVWGSSRRLDRACVATGTDTWGVPRGVRGS